MLEGHPTPLIPWVDVATGSLGQGLPIGGRDGARRRSSSNSCRPASGCSAATARWPRARCGRRSSTPPTTSSTTSTAIIDVNRLGQRGETMVGWNLDVYVARAAGVRLERDRGRRPRRRGDRRRAYAEADRDGRDSRPSIVARTIKGKGVAAVEDQNGWHGKPLDDPRTAIAELGGAARPHGSTSRSRSGASPCHDLPGRSSSCPRYELGTEVATRKAYGDALAALGTARPRRRRARRRGLELHVHRDLREGASRALLRDVHRRAAAGRGCGRAAGGRLAAVRVDVRRVPLARVRLRRAWRRSAARRCSLSGSHAGVSIGEDGPSQMALEDIAALRAVHGSHGPASLRREPDREARRGAWPTPEGISYLAHAAGPRRRFSTRPDEEFEIGGSRVLRSSESDDVALIGARDHRPRGAEGRGRARARTASRRVSSTSTRSSRSTRETLQAAARGDRGKLVTIEDHWPEGGLGDAVLAALADTEDPPRSSSSRVHGMPRSGKPDELLAAAGIDAEHIAAAAASTRRRIRADRLAARPLPFGRHGRPHRVRAAQGVRRAIRCFENVSVHGRSHGPALARRRERSREDDTAARDRRRDRRCRAASSRSQRGRGSRCTTSARRSSSTSRCASTRSPARATCSRSRPSSAQLEQAMAEGAHDAATLRRYSEAQARLEHAGGWAWRDRAAAVGPRPRLRGR